MRDLRRNAVGILMIGGLFAAGCSSDDGNAGDNTAAPEATEATAGTGTGATQPNEPQLDLSGVTLKVAYSTEDPQTFIREQAGAFNDTEYNIEWVELSGSNPTVEALNAGAIDVAIGLQAPAVVLAQANAPEPWTAESASFLIAALWDRPGNFGFALTVQADAGIESVEQLVGKKIAYARGSLGEYYWLKAREAAGLEEGDVEEVILPASDARTAFRAGEVDALISGYRSALVLVAEGSAEIIGSSQDYVPYYSITVARNATLADEAASAALADFIERLADEEQWIADHVDIVAAALAENYEIPDEQALELAGMEARRRVRMEDQAELLQEMADSFFTSGAATTNIDVTVLFDVRFDEGVEAPT